ncbi:uncharacterized protein LOC143341935 isoform X2 [Colletes latitarsis]|uniref:uncharacterized protein LOC143341935 isoform X2 n=1 Tax=Colletes latitarsis TaxID=2605962 RepID=UPI0040370DBB
MRLVKKTLPLIYSVVMCVIAESSGTVSMRTSRSLPFDLSPSRWSGMFRTVWSGERFWEWPRNSVEGLLKLLTSPNTRKKMVFEFRPEDGPRASYAYQKRYGYRGQWLIELLGSGFNSNGINFFQSLPTTILVPPPPPVSEMTERHRRSPLASADRC